MRVEGKTSTLALGEKVEEISQEDEETENTREKVRKLEDYCTRHHVSPIGVKERTEEMKGKNVLKGTDMSLCTGKAHRRQHSFSLLCKKFPQFLAAMAGRVPRQTHYFLPPCRALRRVFDGFCSPMRSCFMAQLISHKGDCPGSPA